MNGYQAMEQRALKLFDSPNFEADLNQVLCNQYYGTNFPVDREIEEAVKREMEASYRKLQSQYEEEEKKQCSEKKEEEKEEEKGEEKNMGFDTKPVSLEEYNQTLRKSVNDYYTHAKNDPSMSREEAIRSTGEMAEKYLEAVEAFEASQNAQQGITGEGSGGVTGGVPAEENGVNDSGVTEDSGISNGGADTGEGLDGEGLDGE